MNLNKKIIIILVVLIILSTNIFVVSKINKNTSSPMLNQESSDTFLEKCFVYEKDATINEPYSVVEELKIVLGNGIVSGSKIGFQSGPDMTNGYHGSIDGFIKDDTIETVFTYIIEGYEGTERELYKINNDSITKMRYQLEEGDNGLLVPNMNSKPIEQIYFEKDC